MTTLNETLVNNGYEGVYTLDGFDEAFIGIGVRCSKDPLPIYSWEKMVEVLVQRDGMDEDEAMEYISFNSLGAWFGEKTPIIMLPLDA